MPMTGDGGCLNEEVGAGNFHLAVHLRCEDDYHIPMPWSPLYPFLKDGGDALYKGW
jgi:hypothetical protein